MLDVELLEDGAHVLFNDRFAVTFHYTPQSISVFTHPEGNDREQLLATIPHSGGCLNKCTCREDGQVSVLTVLWEDCFALLQTFDGHSLTGTLGGDSFTVALPCSFCGRPVLDTLACPAEDGCCVNCCTHGVSDA